MTGLTITLVNPNKGLVDLSWQAVTTATSYQLQITNPNGTVTTPSTGTATTYAGTWIQTFGLIQFAVRACNATGCSAWSAPVSTMISSG